MGRVGGPRVVGLGNSEEGVDVIEIIGVGRSCREVLTSIHLSDSDVRSVNFKVID